LAARRPPPTSTGGDREWKAYRGAVPKNEVLHFKAVTDDLYDGTGTRVSIRPVLRLFGVAGDASDPLRRYTARFGIALVERSRWPACWPTRMSADPTAWPRSRRPRPPARPPALAHPADAGGLPDRARRHLDVPRATRPAAVVALLALQDRWSERLWDLVDIKPTPTRHRRVAA